MWNIRNFARLDSNILNPRISKYNEGNSNILRYEFPLMQWTIGMTQRVIGERIEVVRIFMFLIGISSILGFYLLLKKVIDEPIVALFTAILFQYSPLFYYYTFNPIPDNLALSFIIWYLYFILRFEDEKKLLFLFASGISLLGATAVKLPYLMFSIVSIFFFIRNAFLGKKRIKIEIYYAIIQLIIVSPALLWYYKVMSGWAGNPILLGIDSSGFIIDFDVKMLRFQVLDWLPNLLMNKVEITIATIGLFSIFKFRKNNGWVFSVVAILVFYLLLFSVPIGYIHDYYMLPFLIVLYILLGIGFKFLLKKYLIFILSILTIFSAVRAEYISNEKWTMAREVFNNDVFLYAEELKGLVPDNEKCIILNDISSYIFSYKIDKVGYIFRDDYLPIHWVKDIVIKNNVRYVYSDSRVFDENKEFTNLVEEIIFEKGSIKVFKLFNKDSPVYR